MSLRKLHVIAFDVPFPPDYGGVIDVYYKLIALKRLGVEITLHCFEYGRKQSQQLEEAASVVFYYPRRNSKSLLFNTYPYIVLSRNSAELRERLLQDDAPVLMEGLHSTYLLNDPDFASRKMIVRTHNIEHEYYENLARVEKNIFKRYYFYNEAGKLAKYESSLKKAAGIAAISPADKKHFSGISDRVEYVPAFHPFDSIEIKAGVSDYALYHGNLAVGENNEAALYLAEKVFNDLPFRLVIAGNRPSVQLRDAAMGNKNISLLENLSPGEIYALISGAQCNVLPTFQATGIKLKLLAALFLGKSCIVNSPMVVNTGLKSLCLIADTPEEMKRLVKRSMSETVFEKSEIKKREEILLKLFSNEAGGRKILEMMEI